MKLQSHFQPLLNYLLVLQKRTKNIIKNHYSSFSIPLRSVPHSHSIHHFLLPFLALTLTTLLTFFTLSIFNHLPKTPTLKKGSGNTLYLVGNKVYSANIGTKDNQPTIDFQVNSASISFTLSGIQQQPAEKLNKHTLIYRDILNNTDLQYTTLPNGIKEEIILKAPPTDNSAPNHVYLFDLNFTNTTPKTITQRPDSVISLSPTFKDKDNNYLFHFEKPYAYDATGARTDNVTMQIGQDKSIPDKYYLKLTIDPTWLNSPKRVYPITIDPTIVHDTSTEFASGTFNRVKDTGAGSYPSLETYYQELSADEHTVGLWHMNETSGTTVADDSGNSNDGTASGTTIVDGKMNKARDFDGTDDYVSINDNDILDPKEITIEAWIKVTTLQAGNFVDKGDNSGYRFRTMSDGTLQFFDRGSTNYITSEAIISTGTWFHVAAVGDDSGLKIYINGKLDISNTTAYGGANTTSDLLLGAYSNGTAEFFAGVLDEVRISNIARTPEEIKASASRRPYSVYTSEVLDLTKVESWNSLSWNELGVATSDGETLYDDTDLVAQWNFNETSGTTADNAEGTSALDGTLTNFSDTTGQDTAIDSGWTANNRRWGAGALMFDGTDDYVEVPNNTALNPQNAISIEFWTKPIKTGMSINKGNFNQYYVYGSGSMSLRIYTSAGDLELYSKNELKDGNWHHWVGTWSNSDGYIRTYIDGKLSTISSSTLFGTINTQTNNLTIGAGKDTSGGYYFGGTIDSVRIYSRALSASEIMSNYNAGNIQFQTRVGDDTSPDDGSWDAWTPTTGETTIDNMDNPLDWATPSASLYSGVPMATSSASTIKTQGTGSLKLTTGALQVDSHTVGLWHLNETGGSGAYIKDSSDNNNDGTPTGTTVTQGVSGKARNFDGVDDYISVGTTNQPTNTFTVETWFTVNSTHEIDAESDSGITGTSGQKYLFGATNQGTDAGMGVSVGTNGISVYEHGSSYMPAIAVYEHDIPSGWNYLAIVYHDKQPSIYLNGVRVHTGLTSTKTNVYATSNIGGGSYGYHDGSIDEVRISDTARSAEEIAEAYRAGRDHYLNKTISSTDLSGKDSIPFWIAGDRPGTYLDMTVGESAYANYQPDSNTVGLWHLNNLYYQDNSGNGYNGTYSYYGIEYGIKSSNLTLIANQWGGSANDGEVDITCTGGDAKCEITTLRGNTISTPSINYGVAMDETTARQAYIMYSPSLADQGITPFTNNSDNYIAIRYNSGWEYDRNGSWYSFTPTSNNIIIASLTQGNPSVTNLTQLDFHGNTQTTGKIGQAINFTGGSQTGHFLLDYSTASTYQNNSSNTTIDGWFKANINSGGYSGARIISRDCSEYFCIVMDQDSGTGLNIYYSDTEYTSLDLPSQTDWHHFTMVWDTTNTNFKFYLDGQLRFEDDSLSSFASTNRPIGIGGNVEYEYNVIYPGFGFSGIVDEVRISNTTRTASEIRQAYEIGRRTHPITIDFSASLDSTDLITDSTDTSFTIDATTYGLENKGSALYKGDKIIIRENYGGTEYITQGTVTAVTESTGAVTVASWDTGSTFPSSGFTANADVFKWQHEYFPIADNTLSSYMDGITQLTLRLTNGHEGHTIWLDDLKSTTGYLTNSSNSTITSATEKRYFQYRAILTSLDEAVSATLSAVTLDYVENTAPNTPTLDSPTDGATGQSLTPTLKTTATDADSDYLRYKIELCTDSAMTANCQTFDQTSSQTGWSGQNTQSNTAYTSGTQANYTLQTSLSANTTYYWRSYAIDPGGINTWSSTQTTPYSFTTSAPPTAPTDLLTEGATNPTSVTDTTPEFSAIHHDPDGDSAEYYQIEVNTASDFTGTVMWDSGKTAMTTTADNTRSPDISYAGTTLNLDGTTYYWRIRFWDTNNLEGAVSITANFTMAVINQANNCRIQETTNDSSLTVLWTDNANNEDYYQIDRSVDNGSWTTLSSSLSANSQSYQDTTISDGHTYRYRIAPYISSGPYYADWCYTDTLTLQTHTFNFEGINFKGINLD